MTRKLKRRKLVALVIILWAAIAVIVARHLTVEQFKAIGFSVGVGLLFAVAVILTTFLLIDDD